MAQLSRQRSDASQLMSRFESLPDEVIEAILFHLDARSLSRVSVVSKRLLPVADEHLIWKGLCLRDFTFWDASHDIEGKKSDPSFYHWKGLYAVRATAYRATKTCIRQMVDIPLGRLEHANRILDHGYGIKDALLHLIRDAPSTDCPLAQRYWSEMVMGCLNRSLALDQWTRLRFRSDMKNPTELGLACMDMFILGPNADGDIQDTFRRLDEYVATVRAAYPDLDGKSPRTKAVVIAEFLRRNKWIGIDEGRNYYSIEHQFLGLALRSQHRNSLPLISCVIYCYVCRAFNVRAQPCSFPMHVHAVLQPPLPDDGSRPLDLDNNPLPPDHSAHATQTFTDIDSTADPPTEQTHLYIDPFHTHEPVSLAQLLRQISFTVPGASTGAKATYLLPASPRSLLIRTSLNMIRSLSQGSATAAGASISVYDAAYAALFAQAMFPSDAEGLAMTLTDLRQHFAHHYVEDLRNYENYVLPMMSGLGVGGRMVPGGDNLVPIIREQDTTEPRPKRRAEITRGADGQLLGQEIKYSIGQVFRHRRQGYRAVIYGWDGKCDMEEGWIRGNGVDRLSGGRSQPFYNAFVDDRSTRYVAQENVQVLGPDEFREEDVETTFAVDIGKWFKRFDPQTARFVSNIKNEYPED